MKTGQIKRCLGTQETRRHVVATRNPRKCAFYQLFQKTIVLFQNEIGLCERTENLLTLNF